MNGVRNVPAMYLHAGRNFGLSAPALFARVIFPAALPRVLTGLRVALGVAWIGDVAAEMIAVNSGLGYLVIDSRNAGKRYDLVIAAMLLIGLIGLALNQLVEPDSEHSRDEPEETHPPAAVRPCIRAASSTATPATSSWPSTPTSPR